MKKVDPDDLAVVSKALPVLYCILGQDLDPSSSLNDAQDVELMHEIHGFAAGRNGSSELGGEYVRLRVSWVGPFDASWTFVTVPS